MNLLWVALGAAFGAPLRWLIDTRVQVRYAPIFPWGTFIANVVGSLLLGFLAYRYQVNSVPMVLFGIGFCGSLTTFSSFAWETLQLSESGATRLTLVNIVGSVAICIGVAAIGWGVGAAVS